MEIKIMESNSYPNVKFFSAEEIKKLYDKNEVTIIDVREKEEWDKGHIEGAKFIPLSSFSPAQVKLDNKKHLVIHCRSGRRCGIASEQMIQSGYTKEIIRMKGGLIAWSELGYKITTK